MLLLYLFVYIPAGCLPGVRFRTSRNDYSIVKTESNYSGQFWDPVFEGSFCPSSSGNYQIEYQGNVNNEYEHKIGFYKLANSSSNSRITPLTYLYKGRCYPFYTLQSNYPQTNGWGNLYIKGPGGMFFANQSNSYSCSNSWCLNGANSLNCIDSTSSGAFHSKHLLILSLNLFLL